MDAAAIPVSIHPARDEGAEVASVCCYCGTGCGVRVRVSQGAVLAVRGDDSHPPTTAGCAARAWPWPTRSAPIMRACSPRPGARARTSRASRSGWTRRWTSPPTGWPTPSSGTGRILLFYLSGQLLTEDYAVFNKLARALVGTNNIDTNSRLCMSSAVSGYKRTLGADAPPACYEDLELADTVLIAGSNMAYAHPVLFRRRGRPRAPARHETHRGRSAPHRHGLRRRSAPAADAGLGRGAVPRHAERDGVGRAGRPGLH